MGRVDWLGEMELWSARVKSKNRGVERRGNLGGKWKEKKEKKKDLERKRELVQNNERRENSASTARGNKKTLRSEK